MSWLPIYTLHFTRYVRFLFSTPRYHPIFSYRAFHSQRYIVISKYVLVSFNCVHTRKWLTLTLTQIKVYYFCHLQNWPQRKSGVPPFSCNSSSPFIMLAHMGSHGEDIPWKTFPTLLALCVGKPLVMCLPHTDNGIVKLQQPQPLT